MHPIHALIIQILIGFLLCGCTGEREDVVQATQAQVRYFADEFYASVLDRDAKHVYRLTMPTGMDEETFKSFFEENYIIFLEQAYRLRDASQIGVTEIYALRHDEPCGGLRFIVDSNHAWKLQTVPGPQAAESVEMQKKSLIEHIQTRQFMRILDTYSLEHPEMQASRLRALKRSIAYEEIPVQNVRFMGPTATVTLEANARLYFTCDSGTWRLSQCIFTP